MIEIPISKEITYYNFPSNAIHYPARHTFEIQTRDYFIYRLYFKIGVSKLRIYDSYSYWTDPNILGVIEL